MTARTLANIVAPDSLLPVDASPTANDAVTLRGLLVRTRGQHSFSSLALIQINRTGARPCDCWKVGQRL